MGQKITILTFLNEKLEIFALRFTKVDNYDPD